MRVCALGLGNVLIVHNLEAQACEYKLRLSPLPISFCTPCAIQLDFAPASSKSLASIIEVFSVVGIVIEVN